MHPPRPAATSAVISVASIAAIAGYDATAKLLHWLVVVLVFTQFIISFLMPEIGPGVVPGTLINLHLSFGVLIFAVILFRLMHRLRHPVPLDMPDSPAWERWVAVATHRLFYFLLLVAPFLGWASASAHNLPLRVFGLGPLPYLVAPKARIGLVAGDVHAVMMWTLLALIGVHALAALYHHLVRRDTVLQRMLPGRGR